MKNIEQKFNPSELSTIKRFLAWVNESAKNDSKFADDESLDELNQFSELAESDEDIRTSVKDWLKLKKTRLRGASQTNN